jgi:peroxiredoxin
MQACFRSPLIAPFGFSLNSSSLWQSWSSAVLLVISGIGWLSVGRVHSEEKEGAAGGKQDISPGHSFHAEAFNDGPRQAAYLMQGMGNVHWKTSSSNPMAQRFFDQGLAQLHGFWYFEAERSFRQAASIEPERAIFYWGMARANVENPDRSAAFIEQAMKRLDKSNAIERRLIEAWSRRVKDWPQPPEAKPESKPNEKQEQKTDSKKAEKASVENEAQSRAKKKRVAITDEIRDKRKERLKNYVRDLEDLVQDYPEDIELKAMIVLQYWQNQGQGIEIQSYAGVDALLSDIFRRNPRHPAHHFRIHLWDYRKENLAIVAAAECGPSAPGIAHMWHMPGHTYSRLHRYADAAWQQEASARVDHAHMIRDRIMPDQIHNYAHNNEWLIRNWIHLGRPNAAVQLAKNMIELPRHPKYNSPGGSGSSSFGRQRLFAVLRTFRLWDVAFQLADSPYVRGADGSPAADEAQMLKGIAAFETGRLEEGQKILDALRETRRALLIESMAEGFAPTDAALQSAHAQKAPLRAPALGDPTVAPKDAWGEEQDLPFVERISKDFDEEKWKDKPEDERAKEKVLHEKRYRSYRLAGYIAALESHAHGAKGEYRQALQRGNQIREQVDLWQRITWCQASGEHALAMRKAKDAFNGAQGEIVPSLLFAIVAHQAVEALAGRSGLKETETKQIDEWKEDRKRALERCAKLAGDAEPNLKWIDEVKKISAQVLPDLVWGMEPSKSKDLGDRPSLDSLGPVRWFPPTAPTWSLPVPEGVASLQGAKSNVVSSSTLRGKPHLLVFYLGFGCLHCAEQLKEISPKVEAFRQMGIEVIGVSTEDAETLTEGLQRYETKMELPLLANSDLDVFQSYRCFDDFEGQPLHGTILVDSQGRIRWQDIGYEPFMEIDFLMDEAKRLLAISAAETAE